VKLPLVCSAEKYPRRRRPASCAADTSRIVAAEASFTVMSPAALMMMVSPRAVCDRVVRNSHGLSLDTDHNRHGGSIYARLTKNVRPASALRAQPVTV
jgi:hypothetical protein